MSVTLQVKFNTLPEIARQLPEEAALIVDKFLSDVDARATMAAPVRTGNLRNNRSRAQDRITWHAEYAAFVNYGTRYMAARPFVTSAVAAALPGAAAAVAALSGRLGE